MNKSLPWMCVLLMGLCLPAKAQQLEWHIQSGSTQNETNILMDRDTQGNIYHVVSFGDAINVAGVNLNPSVAPSENFYIAKYDSLGSVVFIKSFLTNTANNYLRVKDAYQDQNGSLFICGELFGTVDLDPNAGVSNLTSQGDSDIFFAKFNSSGVLDFARRIGGANADEVSKISADQSGNVYLYGNFSQAMDFDPGTGVNTETPLQNDLYLAKYSSSGNFLDVSTFGFADANAFITPDRVLFDEDNNIYFTGSFKGTYDFDPGTGVQSQTSFGFAPSCTGFCRFSTDYFIAKLLSNGTFGYVNVFSAKNDLETFDPSVLLIENRQLWIINSGFLRNADLDPGPGTVLTSSIGTTNYLAKYDQNGNYIAVQGIDLDAEILQARVVNGAEIQVWGEFRSAVDFDPGIGVVSVTPKGSGSSFDIFFGSYDLNFNYNYVYTLGDVNNEYIDNGVSFGQNDVVLAAYFDSFSDIDPDPARTEIISSAGGNDVFLAKLRLRPLDAGTFVEGDANICTQQSAYTYRIDAVDGATEYAWTLPAGVTPGTETTTLPFLEITFDQVLSGPLRVKPINSFGEGEETVLNINVQGSPDETLTTDAPANSICLGESISFSGVSGQGTYAFFVDNVLQQTGTTPEFTFTGASSDFTLRYTVTNANNCTSETSLLISVLDLPGTGFTGDTIVCEQDNVALFAADQGADLYLWRKGTSIIGTSSVLALNEVRTSDTGNDYTLEVSRNGCASVRSFSIQVNPGPNSTLRQECITNTGNLTIELRATEQNADTYIWRRGNTIIGNTANVTLNNPVINGLEEYQLTLTKNGCSSTSEAFALSVDIPDAAGLIFGQNDVFRGQTQVNYSLNPINGATSYIWSLPPGAQAQNGSVITTNPVTLVETLTPSLELNFALDASDGLLSVRGRNDCNGEGPSSVFNVFMIPFPAPTNLLVSTISGSSIELIWDDNSAGSASTEIERSLDPINFSSYASVSPGTDTFMDNNVQIGIRYYYRVRSFTGNVFSGFSNIGAAVASNVPIAPSGLTATILSPSEVRLDWSDNSSNETGFRIELSSILSDNIFLEGGTPGANTNQFIITGLEPNQVYFFRVRAGNLEGESPFSNIVEVEMPPSGGNNIPAIPENIFAESVSETQIRLNWDDNINNAAVYKIERSQGDPNNFTEVGRLPVGNSQFLDEGLQPEAFYFYRIIAANADGNAPPSDTSAAQAICNLRVLVTREDANSNTICEGKAAFLQLTTNTTGARIQWKRDGINIPNANQNTYIADREGDYTCEVTTGGCRKESQTGVVLIERDGVDVQVALNPDNGRLEASIANADQYQWYLNGEIIPGATQSFYAAVLSGSYHVTITLENSGCSVSSPLFLFNVTSIEDVDLSKQLNVSPNPAHQWIRVQLDTGIQGSYEVYLIDSGGKRFLLEQGEKRRFSWEKTYAVESFAASVYVLHIKLANRHLVKKVVIRH